MHCPNCGKRLSFIDMTWKERLFWSALATIALNSTAQFYELVATWMGW